MLVLIVPKCLKHFKALEKPPSNFRERGHPRVTIIIPIRCISEIESLFSRGSDECLRGSTGADGGQFHHEKVISTVFIFLSGALGGSSEANRGQFH